MACAGQDRELRNDAARHVAEAHAQSRLQPDGLKAVQEVQVGFEFIGRFITGEAEVGGPKQHHRHGVVDERDRRVLDEFAKVAGGQERAGLGAERIEERQLDRSRRAGHAVDGGLALVFHDAGRGLDYGLHRGRGVAVEDPDGGLADLGRNQSRLDGKGPTADSMLPQFGLKSTKARSVATWAKR